VPGLLRLKGQRAADLMTLPRTRLDTSLFLRTSDADLNLAAVILHCYYRLRFATYFLSPTLSGLVCYSRCVAVSSNTSTTLLDHHAPGSIIARGVFSRTGRLANIRLRIVTHPLSGQSFDNRSLSAIFSDNAFHHHAPSTPAR
jgi:hypothetical protein